MEKKKRKGGKEKKEKKKIRIQIQNNKHTENTLKKGHSRVNMYNN